MKKAEIILFETEAEYLSEYKNNYIKGGFFLLDIPVIFSEEDFAHIFSEPDKNGVRSFSFRRAKRMHFLKAILTLDSDIKKEIMFEEETGNIAVFCLDLECVIYLRIRVGSKALQCATFFDFGKDHTKMYKKQKIKCISISDTQLKEKVYNSDKEAVILGPTTS